MLRVINYDRLVSQFAEELAYCQNAADYWYYVQKDQEMSSFMLDNLGGLRDVASKLGILQEVYDCALQIYDFSKSGTDDFVPNIALIRDVYDHFEEYKHSTLLF